MEKTNVMIMKNVGIFDGVSIKVNKNVYLSKNKILDIKDANKDTLNDKSAQSAKSVKILEGHGNLLIPGFIDIQVNGGGGAFFNKEPTVQGLNKIFQAHLKYGTTSIFPTFISDSIDQFKKCLLAVQNIQKNKSSGIIGLHVEGPFINAEKKGIHPEKNIIHPSKEWLKILTQTKLEHMMITLAPEMVSADFIKKLVKKNVHVFAGHTNTSAKNINQSFEIGVSGVTHLFNACSQITARDVGVVGASLLKKNILCSLIVDGNHISYDALKIAFALKNKKDFILVSDAMESVGTKMKKFKLFEEDIFINKNELKNKNGVLAGSHLTMLWAFKNLMKNKLVSLEEGIRMTSTNQADFFRIKNKGAVLPGYDTNILLIDKNNFDLLNVIFFEKM